MAIDIKSILDMVDLPPDQRELFAKKMLEAYSGSYVVDALKYQYASASKPARFPQPETPKWTAYQKLAMRMDWTDKHPFHFLNVVLAADKAKHYVIIVTQVDAVIMEDDSAMFPSDDLVSKIRLMAP